MIDAVIIISLIAICIILLLIELFFIPGIGVAGITAAIVTLGTIFYAFTHIGMGAGIATLVALAALSIWAIMKFMRSRTLDKLSLKETLNSPIEKNKGFIPNIGDEGVSITRLALVGTANIQGHIIEVCSEDGLLNPKEEIVVTRIDNNVVYVAKK